MRASGRLLCRGRWLGGCGVAFGGFGMVGFTIVSELRTFLALFINLVKIDLRC